MSRILVIDDDVGICQMVQQLLQGKGYEVDTAHDGQEGLKRYQEQPADLVITDLFMPEKDGLQAIAELQQLSPDVKLIAISGNPQGLRHGYLELAGDKGAARTLTKPFSVAELVTTVQQLLNG